MKAMELKVSRKGYWRNIPITLIDKDSYAAPTENIAATA